MAEVQAPQLLQQRDAVRHRGGRLALQAGQRVGKGVGRLLPPACCCAGAGGGEACDAAQQRGGGQAAAGAAASDAQGAQPAAALQAVPQGGQLGCAGAPLNGQVLQGGQARQHLRARNREQAGPGLSGRAAVLLQHQAAGATHAASQLDPACEPTCCQGRAATASGRQSAISRRDSCGAEAEVAVGWASECGEGACMHG